MLRSIDMEALGYDREGEAYCPPCARREFGELVPAKCEAGLCETLHPLSRFELEEEATERSWYDAEERVARFEVEHPVLRALIAPGERHRFIARVSLERGREQCVKCGDWITPSRGQAIRAERAYEARCVAAGRMPGGLYT